MADLAPHIQNISTLSGQISDQADDPAALVDLTAKLRVETDRLNMAAGEQVAADKAAAEAAPAEQQPVA